MNNQYVMLLGTLTGSARHNATLISSDGLGHPNTGRHCVSAGPFRQAVQNAVSQTGDFETHLGGESHEGNFWPWRRETYVLPLLGIVE
jgi:hypothetical protein